MCTYIPISPPSGVSLPPSPSHPLGGHNILTILSGHSVALSTSLCDSPHHLLQNVSSSQPDTLHPLNTDPPSPSPSPWQHTLLLSVFMNLTTLGISYEYLSFDDWLVLLNIMSPRFHPCCSEYQNFFFLGLNDIPLYARATFTYPFTICSWALGLLLCSSCCE